MTLNKIGGLWIGLDYSSRRLGPELKTAQMRGELEGTSRKEARRDGVVANQVVLHFGYDAPDTRFTGDSACCVEVAVACPAKATS